MKLLKGPLWVWLTFGLIGLGLTAYAEDISALIKARATWIARNDFKLAARSAAGTASANARNSPQDFASWSAHRSLTGVSGVALTPASDTGSSLTISSRDHLHDRPAAPLRLAGFFVPFA